MLESPGAEAEGGTVPEPRLRSAASIGEVSREEDCDAALDVRTRGAPAPDMAGAALAPLVGEVWLFVPTSEAPRCVLR